MLSLSPGRRYSRLESSADVSPLTTPPTTPSRGASLSTEGKRSMPGGRHDQRRCGHRPSGDRGTSSGSMSSASRLTPPGQRTPTLSLSSPPSLKNLAGGVYPQPRRCAAATEGLPASSEAFSTPPRRHAVTCDPTPGCGGYNGAVDGGVASPPCLLGLTSCIHAFTADRTMNPSQLPGGAAPALCETSSSSPSTLDRPDDESSGSDAARPHSENAAGRRALSDVERDSRCIGRPRAERGEYPRNAGQQCAGGQGESGAGDDESQPERSADGGRRKDEHTGDDEGDSGPGGDEKKGDPGRRQNSDGRGYGGRDGGAGGGNDGDGAKNSGESGTQDDKGEEVDEDDDGEDEADECGADEDIDTFLRLSEVEFCEGVDVLQYGGTSARCSTSSEALDSSNGGRSSGGGDENSRVLSRHLSDFFRSPLARDSTPKQRYSSIGSVSDVQTGARLFDSAKSANPDGNGSSNRSGSNMLDSTNYVGAFSSTAGGTSEVTTSVPVNCDDSPPFSAPAVADAAAITPDSIVAEEDAANHHASPGLPSLPTDETDDAKIAENDEFLAKTRNVEVNADPVLVESQKTEAIEEENAQVGVCDDGDRDDSIDGGGGESEEEWLTHPDTNVVTPGLENWGLNSGSTLPPLGDHETTKTNATSTISQEAEPTVGHDWTGLNEDGSWRTEVARQAAGEAGAVEAERRRLAKISADESWRSDAGEVDGKGCHSTRDVRRESISFTRLQTGNVR